MVLFLVAHSLHEQLEAVAVPGRCVLQIWLAALVLLLNSNYLHSSLLYNRVCYVWPCLLLLFYLRCF